MASPRCGGSGLFARRTETLGREVKGHLRSSGGNPGRVLFLQGPALRPARIRQHQGASGGVRPAASPGAAPSPSPRASGGGGAGWILSSTFLPLSPHENLNQGCREETFHTKSRQTGGTSTVSSLTCFKERKMNRRGKKIE